MPQTDLIISSGDPILITGANSFIGSRVVEALLRQGFSNLRCFVRASSNLTALQATIAGESARVQVIKGNLLSPEDCARAGKDAAVILHVAAGGADKTFAGSYMNSVVTTRNLLEMAVAGGSLRRFLLVSSFSVYSNWNIRRGGPLNETCELETRLVERAEAYAFAKLKQEEIVLEYARKFGFPYVILRPGAVYGPGARHITGRVGINTFGVFFHLGGSNQLPLTYVDNCAEAIALAGTKSGVDGEVFNVVDDDLPSSRRFLKRYKRDGRHFRSLYIPYWLFYVFSWFWESYSKWSKGQLPPAFNRLRCAAYWKGNTYSNRKLKDRLGWRPAITFAEGTRRYFEYVRRVADQC
jgi:nucleoside-diphosphate-sugar epimerase